MGSEEPKDLFKGVDWKAVGTELQKGPCSKPVIKKRLPKKMRHIPDYYFLPWRSLSCNLGFFFGLVLLVELVLACYLRFGLIRRLKRMEVLCGSLINETFEEIEKNCGV